MGAGHAPVPSALTAASAPVTRCTIGDSRLAELSGLAVDGGAVWSLVDSGRSTQAFALDLDTCEVTDVRTGNVDPRDAEDLARGPDGALWVGDIGDNDRVRNSVALVVLPARGPAQLHRMTYPDGPHDAEALLVDAQGRPVVVTKEVGPAGIYRPDAPLDGTGPTPLVRVGEVVLPTSDTRGGPIGGLGARVVTGAAQSVDGRVLALRSYTDAWLYAVPDGDPVAALAGTPVRVPLPGEPQGEAVAFTADGTLLSGSETRGGVAGELRAVAGAAALVPSSSAAAVPRGSGIVPSDSGAASGSAPRAGAPGAGNEGVAPAAGAGPGEDTAPVWLPAVIGGGATVGVLALAATALAMRGRRR